MDAEVALLARREIRAGSDVLARAFAADPVIGHYLAGARRRRFAYPAFFRSSLYELAPLRSAYVVRASGALGGVAARVPPEGAAGRPNMHARASALAVRALYPTRGGKLFAEFEGLSALHPLDPHWYLAFVGIEPKLQGRGLGGQLLAPVLERADLQGVLCYLETPFSETLSFYERLGFQIRSESTPFSVPTSIWTMLRPPAAPTVGAEH